jgi:3-dehydroquinate dehydratase
VAELTRQRRFGTLTLADYDREIRAFACALKVEAETFHSNIEGEAADRFYAADEAGVAGVCAACVAGFGIEGYDLALRDLLALITRKQG